MKKNIQEQRVFLGNTNVIAEMESSPKGLEDNVGEISQTGKQKNEGRRRRAIQRF